MSYSVWIHLFVSGKSFRTERIPLGKGVDDIVVEEDSEAQAEMYTCRE